MNKRPTESDDWSEQSEALFHSARVAHAPTSADRARVRSELAQKLAAASGAPATGGDVQTRLADSGMTHAALGKLAKVGLGVACALVGAVAFIRAGDSDSRERTSAKPIAMQTGSAGAKPAQRAAEPEVAVGASAATPRVAPSPAAGARSLGTVPARPAARTSPVLPTPEKVSVSRPAPKHTQPSAVEQVASVGGIAPALRGGATSGIAPALRGGATSGTSRSSPRPDAPAESAENTADARAELEFVARINAAVRASAPQAVLALCAEHERRWPHGIFEQEREGTRAIASCNARSTGAGARAREFLASHPRAAIAARVREECAPLLTAASRSQGRQ